MPSNALRGCYGARNLVAIRASRLNSDGTRICPNTDGSAFQTTGPISFSVEPVVETGQTDVQKDGDGRRCSINVTGDVVTGIRGTLELCTLDFQMIEILTGARLLISTEGYGNEFPDPTDVPPTVEFHAWTRTWSGNQQVASPNQYTHIALFNTQWRLGTLDFDEGVTTVPLTFTGETNPNIVIGSFDDIPLDVQGDGQGAWWLASDIPDADVAPYNVNALECGYVDTPACASS